MAVETLVAELLLCKGTEGAKGRWNEELPGRVPSGFFLHGDEKVPKTASVPSFSFVPPFSFPAN